MMKMQIIENMIVIVDGGAEKRPPQGRGVGYPDFWEKKRGIRPKKGTREQGIKSTRPLDLVHALIMRRSGEIICKPLRLEDHGFSGSRIRTWDTRQSDLQAAHRICPCLLS